MKDVSPTENADGLIVVESSGSIVEHQFGMAINAKAFNLVMSGLYSRPIEAILRELTTNAYDAHRMVGKHETVPFKVVVPTRWDDRFAVRDYGCGMSHELVTTIYSTIYASTKEETNDQVGKFGLGSKTPFAYTDQFSVTVWLDGKKRTYNAYRNAQRIPVIALFSEEDCDHSVAGEEQGTEVSFPVQPKDVNEFRKATQRVMLGFDVKPDIEDGLLIKMTPAGFQGNGWGIFKHDGMDGLLPNSPVARQGCVIYPIDLDALINHAFGTKRNALYAMAGQFLMLDMPIGTIEITPSRETLQYDPTTCENLINAINGVFETIASEVSDKLSACKTLFEAVKTRHSVLSAFNAGTMRAEIASRLVWRNKKVVEHICVNDKGLAILKSHGVDIRIGRTGGASGKAKSLLTYNSSPHYIEYNARNTYTQPKFFYWSGPNAPKGVGYRYVTACQQCGSYNNVFVLPDFTPGGFAEACLRVAFGRPDELVLVDLATVEYEKPDYSKTLATVGVWNGRDKFDSGSGKAPAPDDDDVYYVMTNRGDPLLNEKFISTSTLDKTWDLIRDAGLIKREAKLVNIPASRKDIKNAVPEAWIDYFKFIQDLIDTRMNLDNAAKAQASSSYSSAYGNVHYKWNLLVEDCLKGTPPQEFDPSSIFKNACDMLVAFKAETAGDFKADLRLMDIARVLRQDDKLTSYDPSKYLAKVKSIWDCLNAFYPMLNVVLSEDPAALSFGQKMDYIHMVDASLAGRIKPIEAKNDGDGEEIPLDIAEAA